MGSLPAKPISVEQHFREVCSQLSQLGTEYPIVNERRATPRFACDYPARIVSADRSFTIRGRMVNLSVGGTKVRAAFPRDGPASVILHNLATDEIYECAVRWKSNWFVGLEFIDILGPERRRKFLAGERVPLRSQLRQKS